MILVSSCLLGIYSKYDGSLNTHELLTEFCRKGQCIPVCPEQLGGLATPRAPVELTGCCGDQVLSGQGKAVTAAGDDCSKAFIRGAEQLVTIARLTGATAAILKERSPSCGSSKIYDGTFSHTVVPGEGVTAALLRRHGIAVYSEETVSRELLETLTEERTAL